MATNEQTLAAIGRAVDAGLAKLRAAVRESRQADFAVAVARLQADADAAVRPEPTVQGSLRIVEKKTGKELGDEIPVGTVIQFQALNVPDAVHTVTYEPVGNAPIDTNVRPVAFTQTTTLTAAGFITGRCKGVDKSGVTLYVAERTVKAVDPKPTQKPDAKPAPPPPSDPKSYTLLNRRPKIGEVGNKRKDLTSLGDVDYVIKPGDVLVGRSLNGKNILCRLKKNEVAYIVDSTLRGGYRDPNNKGERYCIQCDGNEGMLYVIRCSVHDSSNAGIWGDNFTCIQCDFSEHGADCTKSRRNCKFIECTMHNGGKNNSAAHADGGQTEDGDGVLYQRCTMRMIAGTRDGNTYKGSQGVIASDDSKNITVDDCDIEVWSEKGSSGVLSYSDGGSSATTTIKNSRIKAKLPIRVGTKAKLSANEVIVWN